MLSFNKTPQEIMTKINLFTNALNNTDNEAYKTHFTNMINELQRQSKKLNKRIESRNHYPACLHKFIAPIQPISQGYKIGNFTCTYLINKIITIFMAQNPEMFLENVDDTVTYVTDLVRNNGYWYGPTFNKTAFYEKYEDYFMTQNRINLF